MKHLALFSGVVCACVMTVSLATAQTTPAAPTPAAKPPMMAPAAAKPAAAAPATQTAKSKGCSLEADQKGLHGKARKTFRDACKKA